ncbi:hypothetical protein Taro_013767 [Colocasia esculenta]|uniref:Gnk2-homologous domain-containing protein n=1 Tax=Colocasia esculenta TaxID=4460 RepID=A0A843UJQ6_COLES|nr:hypothetical protein [Colocasia esculenta]
MSWITCVEHLSCSRGSWRRCRPRTPLPFFLLLVASVITVRDHSCVAAASSAFIYAGCSPAKSQPNTPFQANLIALLSSITTSSSQASYNSFAVGNNGSTPPDAAVYGLYQCRNDLSMPDCATCVASALGQLNLVCSYAFSAVLQLDGCLVRYSNDDFLGRPDTTPVFKKCSNGTTTDAEFFRRRDDVLGDLQNGVGFRVSSSGTVQGDGQCLGDLTTADCGACLVAAVGQLKNACGSALAADVFLGQCYARYWASGYYPDSAQDSSEDDIGKTVAIIVGVLAGVALIVIFLSFLKRACHSPYL